MIRTPPTRQSLVSTRVSEPDVRSSNVDIVTVHEGDPGAVPEVSEACARILQSADHEAIQCFRFVLGPSIDRKTPEATVLATMWELARDSCMVLHMICALGAQQLCYEKRNNPDIVHERHAREVRATEHYGCSLRLLVVAAAEDGGGTRELDLVLATLWLMLEYEQRFGDGSGSGLSAHLKGAASILRGRLHKLRDTMKANRSILGNENDVSPSPNSHPAGDDQQSRSISDFASRIVVWISYKDGAAALNGFGGFFNEAVGEVMMDLAGNYTVSLTDGFDALHRRADRAYSRDWPPGRPQTQLMEDMHSRPLFRLFGNIGQIRFLLSRLVHMREANDQALFESSSRELAGYLDALADRYVEFIDVAHTLRLEPAEPHRTFLINMRVVCAHYHAAVLCFFRVIRQSAPLGMRQREALGRIMNIAHQAFGDGGDSAIATLAWPLFVAAMESDDALHRTWVVERYQDLCERGENYRRASLALTMAFSAQRLHERRVDLVDLLRNTSRMNRFLI